nr:uncharacterized protein LOC104822532 [Ipomoea trifida]
MSPFEIVYDFNPLSPIDLLVLSYTAHGSLDGEEHAMKIKQVCTTCTRGRERGRSNDASGFIQFAGTTCPKFNATEYFREEQPKYTLNDAPPVVKKQPKKDRVAWVAYQNKKLEDELKKGPKVLRRKMFYVYDEVYMMYELMNYTGTTCTRGRERGRSNDASGFIQFAGTTCPKFSATEYFREEQPKYTLNDAPPVVKKQPKKDRVAWVAYQNKKLEGELKKGPKVLRRKMFYVYDEVYMMYELMSYTGHEGKYLDGERSFAECIKLFR